MPTSLVGVNTLVPNRLVRLAIEARALPALAGCDAVRAEVPYGEGSRIDLLLARGARRCYVEVKNCSLVVDGLASFPDAVTARGRKHMEELAREVGRGHRAVCFFLLQRMDARGFRPAWSIEP